MFHYNGEFDAKIAVRNLYLESTDLGLKGLGVWAGSRMYRGDDIYLLDFWPLDNLNTLGGGASYQTPEGRTTVALHAGTNQPNNEFYRQMSDRPLPLNQLGATQVDILNRQKFIASARVQQIVPIGRSGGLKFVAYGEGHALPGGQREIEPKRYEDLPADNGFVLGAQVGGFTGERSTHLNLFFRYAHGLAAYGELGTPRSLAPNLTSGGAYEVLGALSGNAEFGPVAVMLGGYARSFRNGSADLDYADVDEGIILARPHVFFGEWGGLAVEGSYQAQARGVTYQQEGAIKGPIVGSVGRFGVVPFLSPAGMGSYSRPQIRLIYALTVRDEGARRMYPEDDVQSLREIDHFFGFGVEWWLNTSWQYGSMLGVRR
jgi:hypothetical protein